MEIDMELQRELFDRLDILAQALGVAVGVLWESAMRNSYARGFMNLGVAVILLSCVAVWVTYLRKKFSDWDPGFIVVGCVLALALTLVSAASIQDGVLQLVAPELYALESLMKALGR